MLITGSSPLKETHDVVIIGAGPAGSTLGFLLSKSNIDALVIDQMEFPRSKLCGGLITWKTRALVEQIYNKKFDDLFKIESISNQFYVFEKNEQIAFLPSVEPFYFINRADYDSSLVALCKAAGCKCIFGEKVIRIDIEKKTVITESKKEFSGRIIVGADGVNSISRRTFFPQKKFMHNLGIALQINVPYDQIKSTYRDPIPKIFFGTIRHGYSWMFPNKKYMLIGMGGLIRENKHPLDTFKRFLDEVVENTSEISRDISAHTVPYGNFIECPGQNGLLLIGDSAGFVDPFLGEGIYYAHKTAEIVAKRIHEYICQRTTSSVVELYRADLDLLYRELVVARRFSGLAFSFLRRFGYRIFGRQDVYLKFVDLVHGKKSYLNLPLISKFL